MTDDSASQLHLEIYVYIADKINFFLYEIRNVYILLLNVWLLIQILQSLSRRVQRPTL